ncbi:hypothetical protein HPB48_015336 [Haemaphysalis longicornis]|uniref:DDE-1 domain-containing protein n=1 Tax=Haemaphysalis longicornis TaxID=44386 RepID=A0A9J6H2B4_HAELO|nr:hypothetical protein HPB48_015336 [Haemaphysalis longicornis]
MTLGMLKSLDEIRGALTVSSQKERLIKTKTGRAILSSVGSAAEARLINDKEDSKTYVKRSGCLSSQIHGPPFTQGTATSQGSANSATHTGPSLDGYFCERVGVPDMSESLSRRGGRRGSFRNYVAALDRFRLWRLVLVQCRRRVIERLLIDIRTADNAADLKVPLVKAVFFASAAWRDVKSETILHCFEKAAFSRGSSGAEEITAEADIDAAAADGDAQ